MILIPDAFAALADPPLKHARILYQTYTRDLAPAAISVSGDAVASPKDAPLRPDTYEYWQAPSLPASWQADLGAEQIVDAVGIAGHTIGAEGVAVGVEYEDGTTENLLLWSESFNNAAWLKNGVGVGVAPTVTANYGLAPDGTMTADRIQFDLNGGTGSGDQSAVTQLFNYPGVPDSTSSVYMKSNTGADQVIQITNINNPANVTVTSEWQRFSHTMSSGFSGASSVAIRARGGITGQTPDLLVWGAALQDTATPLPYVRTESASVEDVPAFWPFGRDNQFDLYRPTDDTPLLFLDQARTSRNWRISLVGDGNSPDLTPPQIGVIYIGQALAMQRMIFGGHSPLPLSRTTVLKNALSRGGRFLGQNFRRHGVAGSAAFGNLTGTWYRSYFDPFVQSARRYPYFFGWRPASRPAEVAYVWTAKDTAPVNQGGNDRVDVSWEMQGIGHSG